MSDNSKLIVKINQLFHNAGIKQENRLDILVTILKSKNTDNYTDNVLFTEIKKMVDEIDYTNKELIQEIFMNIGSKYTKFKLDQFYSPLTLSYFISSLMNQEITNIAIDPAGGTGDLLLYYNGIKHIWDIDENALKLCEFNYELNKQINYRVSCKNSLIEFKEGTFTEGYNYVAMNPPFGSSTVITESGILEKFMLGKNKKKQEIGILFLELGIKLLKENGLLFIIIPSGYIGNKNKIYVELRKYLLQYKVLGVFELPKNTFKRSGTGVNSALLIIQKTACKEPYEIFISSIEYIGYDLSKKNTPVIYKTNEVDGTNIKDIDGISIRNNDLTLLSQKFKFFCVKNNIQNINNEIKISEDCVANREYDYEFIMSNQLDQEILDIKRYTNLYKNTLCNIKSKMHAPITNLSKIIKTNTKIEKTKKYKYIDIGEISTPLYTYKEMYGWELPARAKYMVKKYDILISKLEGSISYCVILNDYDNIIVTNGVAVLRPNNTECLYILFSNILKKEFKIQHKCLTTGSIMASLTEQDIGNILVNIEENVNDSKKIIDTLELLLLLQQ
jgi:hypothetical protein